MATRRRVLLALINDKYPDSPIPNNEIWYTSSDGKIVTPYYSSSFGTAIISNTYIDGVGVIEFKAPITTIGNWAFSECSNLESITIPVSVTTIGVQTFAFCDSLTSVTIPDSVTEIGNGAFYYCRSLTSVTIGDGVTTIRDEAFFGCTSLTSVYCKTTTPPAGGSYMFHTNDSGRKIYVPMESVEAYKSASYWSEYADAIVGYDFEDGV